MSIANSNDSKGSSDVTSTTVKCSQTSDSESISIPINFYSTRICKQKENEIERTRYAQYGYTDDFWDNDRDNDWDNDWEGDCFSKDRPPYPTLVKPGDILSFGDWVVYKLDKRIQNRWST